MSINIANHKLSIRIRLEKIEKIKKPIVDGNFQKEVLGSNSRDLEDILIEKVFQGKNKGTYIDIGANDPCFINNTKLFYDKGWRGINIEPNIKMYNKICEYRPDDINLNIGISRTSGLLTFYELFPDAFSTFNQKHAEKVIKESKGGIFLVSKYLVPTKTLEEIISENTQEKIDFLSLDTEGTDYDILRSNNWDKYRPTILVVEVKHDDRSIKFLIEKKYKMFYQNELNVLFIDVAKLK